jgi:hypothetical protein
MGNKLRILLATMFVLTVVACNASAAQAEEANWAIDGTPVTENVTIKSKSVGVVVEHTGGLLGTANIECSESDEGTVGTGGKDKVTTISLTSCKVSGTSLCTTATAAAVHLPWSSQLEALETETRDKISSGGSGSPGWEATCNGLKISCTAETTTTGAENGSEGVSLIYDSKSTNLSCTDGGTAKIKGTDLAEDPPGHKVQILRAKFLTFNPAAIHFKKILKKPEPIIITYVGPFAKDKLELQTVTAPANYTIIKPNKCETEVFLKKGEACVVEIEMTAFGAAKAMFLLETSIQPESSVLEEV